MKEEIFNYLKSLFIVVITLLTVISVMKVLFI